MLLEIDYFNISPLVFSLTDLARDVCSQVAGHVGVHVPEAVESAEGEVEEESSEDGEIAGQRSTHHLAREVVHVVRRVK